jgi:hypothetical protein
MNPGIKNQKKRMPFGKGKLCAKSDVGRVLLGGWQLNALLPLQAALR